MNAPTNTREGNFIPNSVAKIRQNARRFKGDEGDFTQLQESFIRNSVHLQCTSATHVVDKEGRMERTGQRHAQGRP